jgi:hypothetical protein
MTLYPVNQRLMKTKLFLFWVKKMAETLPETGKRKHKNVLPEDECWVFLSPSSRLSYPG